MLLEKTPESPLDCKEIQPVHPKGDQSWVFIGRTDVEAETPILWPHDVKSWLIWKDPDAGKDWRQEEKGMTEDETVGWHHQLDGHGFGWTPGVGDGQGGLACYGSWGHKESDMTEWLNWTEKKINLIPDCNNSSIIPKKNNDWILESTLLACHMFLLYLKRDVCKLGCLPERAQFLQVWWGLPVMNGWRNRIFRATG